MINEEGKVLVAVYGTLRKGEGNHRLLETSRYIGRGVTKEKGVMYGKGRGFPILRIPAIEGEEGSAYIQVEVYEVTPEVLRHLDLLEGYPQWYSRTPFKVIMREKGEVEAFIYHQPAYFGQPSNIIESGDWKDKE
jgi:gamma-glutamylcyclotransferase (GGCT)/AIG2-like uncharacterized protein YtfP